MSRKGKVSPETKVRIVEECIKGKLGLCEAGRRAGVSDASVRKWISLYRVWEPSGMVTSEKNQSYSPERKEEAVREYLSGKGSQQAICEKYQIRSTKQLQDWIKVYNCHEDFKRQGGGSRMTNGRVTTQK